MIDISKYVPQNLSVQRELRTAQKKILGKLAKHVYISDTPKVLSSGLESKVYFDMRSALADWSVLFHLEQLLYRVIDRENVDALGGLSFGADPIAIGVSAHLCTSWFSIRKEQKKHGMQRLIEGADIKGKRVVIVDDVITTGGSIRKAYETCIEAGATVTQIIVLVERNLGLQNLSDIPVEKLALFQDDDIMKFIEKK